MRHVDANLVRASRQKAQTDDVESVFLRQDFILRHRAFPVLSHLPGD